MANPNALLIFIKNPEKGKVKTRLAKTLGDDQALAIYHRLLKHTRTISISLEIKRYLYYSQFIDQQDDWPNQQFDKQLQASGDLGNRMKSAFAEHLSAHQKVLIIGSDCAQLRSDHLQAALTMLDQREVVIGPAKDGGYYLIGMRSRQDFIFENMPWSQENLLEQTLKKLREQSVSYELLPELSDVDTEAEWKAFGAPYVFD
ncbi:MAG: TIGR04282 family arsenosugar biosynthesis glycosyltransferase [Bacteroidota bacterium]